MTKMMMEEPTEETRQEHITRDDHCRTVARSRNQLSFTLVEQDMSTPKTICFWIMENIMTCPASKLYDALETALIARKYPNRKHAD